MFHPVETLILQAVAVCKFMNTSSAKASMHPWNGSSDQAVVLKKIEMSPSKFPKVMSSAQLTTNRAGKLIAPVSSQNKMQLVGLLLSIKDLSCNFPRLLKPKTQPNDPTYGLGLFKNDEE